MDALVAGLQRVPSVKDLEFKPIKLGTPSHFEQNLAHVQGRRGFRAVPENFEILRLPTATQYAAVNPKARVPQGLSNAAALLSLRATLLTDRSQEPKTPERRLLCSQDGQTERSVLKTLQGSVRPHKTNSSQVAGLRGKVTPRSDDYSQH